MSCLSFCFGCWKFLFQSLSSCENHINVMKFKIRLIFSPYTLSYYKNDFATPSVRDGARETYLGGVAQGISANGNREKSSRKKGNHSKTNDSRKWKLKYCQSQIIILLATDIGLILSEILCEWSNPWYPHIGQFYSKFLEDHFREAFKSLSKTTLIDVISKIRN